MFQTDIDKALERYPNKLIITLEIKVLCIITALKRFKLMDLSEKLKDTTGAGDTFNGAFAVGLQKDIQLHKALKLANSSKSFSNRYGRSRWHANLFRNCR